MESVDLLLVEDNPRDAELTIRALKKRNLANQVIHVEDGEQALDYLLRRGRYAGGEERANPKVVMLDLRLPKIDGLEVLRILKSDPNTRDIPVVVVTSSGEDPDIQRAYVLGANSYVVKPVEFDAFMDAMTNLGFYWLMVNQCGK